MLFTDVITRKRDRGQLEASHFRLLAEGVLTGSIPDYQLSALLMACYLNGLDETETALLTTEMIRSGDHLELSYLGKPVVDKHSTGGVGDKVSLMLAPLVAANGVIVPMISGRGLGHTGGTLDKLEAAPGLRTELDLSRFREILSEVGTGIIGQSANFVPLDGKLYALRNVTATVDSMALITASIMSKKLAEGLDGLVLDVKMGSGGFMKTPAQARALANSMIRVAENMGKRCTAFITAMDQPLGRTVGNALELREAIEFLAGDTAPDLRELVVVLGGAMLAMAGVCADESAGRAKIEASLADGSGLATFAAMLTAQGAVNNVAYHPERLPQAQHRDYLRATAGGYLQAVNGEMVGKAAVLLGAGRQRTDESIDPAVGFKVLHRLGDEVSAREPILEIHWNDRSRLEACLQLLHQAYIFGPEPLALGPSVILETLGTRNGERS